MAVNLSPVGGVAAQFFTNSGAVLTGGKIYTYAAGTSTPQATYTTSAGNVAWTNPIVLDAAGRVPSGGEIWLTDGLQYKFLLKDSNDVLIATYDNVSGINSNFVNYTNEQEIQTATAGQTVFTLTTMQYQPGTGSLSVFVDGVNQYGPGAQYAYVETDSTTVTFVTGLHVGASVKFTTTAINAASYGDAFQISYTPPFTGSVATNVGDKIAQTVSVKDFGAVGDGVTDDTAAIQAALDYAFSAGGGTVLIPKTTADYKVSDTLTIRANTRVNFDAWIELTTASSTGTVLYLTGDNIELINPLVDGGGAASGAGENGVGIVSGNNIQVRGGKVQRCYRGGVGLAFGGKGVQIETGSVEGVLVDGTEFSDCFMSMSTVRDGTNVNADYGIQFTNIKADNCEILFFVKQSNINNTNGLEHTVQLNNFYAVNCGAFEGVMQFSRAANVQVSNGVIVNDPSAVTTPLIRGNHRFCRFDNIRFSGNCTRIIDLDPSTFAIDSSYVCENNTYDINYSGTAGYVAWADVTTTNRILQDCVIKACLDTDVSTKIVGDELRNGFCRLELQQGDKTIISTTATLYLEGRTTFASFPAGISMMRFNSSQITFPATQIASTDANTLDDYEENTWTPSDGSGASLTFSTGYGDYIKIGRMVIASFAVTYPATANGSNATISGLPFSSATTGGRITCGLSLRYTDQGGLVTALNNPGATTFLLANASGSLLTNANMSGKTLQGVLTYMADA